MSETYSIPISNGIFAHRKEIGAALWVFLWLIDHTTKEEIDTDGQLEGLVFGGKQVRSSTIAKDLDVSPRAVHVHLASLCAGGYVRRIDCGDGLPAGYAVRRSKKWKRNQPSATASIEQTVDLAEMCEPSQESANARINTVDPRIKLHYPRKNLLPIRKTVQDNTKQNTPDVFDGAENKTTKTKKSGGKPSSSEVDSVYQAYPLKKSPAKARVAIVKAIERLSASGESEPVVFLLDRIAAFKANRDRDAGAGRFVPNCPYPATWFNGECYAEPGLAPVKNCVLPSGMLGTAAELARTGWTVIRGEA